MEGGIEICCESSPAGAAFVLAAGVSPGGGGKIDPSPIGTAQVLTNALESSLAITEPLLYPTGRRPPLRFTLLRFSGKVNGGNASNRSPRLWRAIFATHRAPHPRIERLLRRSALHRFLGRNQELSPCGNRAVGRAVLCV